MTVNQWTMLPWLMLGAIPNVEVVAQNRAQPELLDEVIVTATKRPERAADVPLSIHAISHREIERSRAQSFRDYLSAVPGVAFADVGLADAKINIRGISTDVFSEVRPLTGVYLDETPIADPGTHFIVQSPANPKLVDVSHVEILRGPQGTLYGAGAMGGAIRIVTNPPDPSQDTAEVGGSFLDTSHGGAGLEADGMLNVGFSPDTALRLVSYVHQFDGFIDNVGTGRDNVNDDAIKGWRLAGRYTPGAADVTATVSRQTRESHGLNISNVSLPRYQQSTRIDESHEDEWTLYNMVARYDFERAQLTSSTSYLERGWQVTSDTSGYLAFFGVDTGTVDGTHTQELGEFVQELRIASRSRGAFEWLAGVFYSTRDQIWEHRFPAPGFDAATGGIAAAANAPDHLGVGRADFEHEQVAAFGELTYRPASRWQMTLGGRGYRIRETSDVDALGLLAGGFTRATRDSDETGFSPKLSVSYQPGEQTLLYATASQGFRPGGPNFTPVPQPLCGSDLAAIGLSSAPDVYRADSLWNYEIGLKGQWREGRVKLSSALYHIDWSDVQLLVFLSCGTAFIHNAGAARSRGGELEFSGRPLEKLELSLGMGYVDAELTSYVRELNVQPGARMPGTPRFNWHGSLTYTFHKAAEAEAFVRVAFHHVDESYGTFVPSGLPRLRAPAYDVVNLRAGLDRSSWSVAIFADNLFDEYGVVNTVDDFGLHPSDDWYNLLRPRTVGVTFRRRFE